MTNITSDTKGSLSLGPLAGRLGFEASRLNMDVWSDRGATRLKFQVLSLRLQRFAFLSNYHFMLLFLFEN